MVDERPVVDITQLVADHHRAVYQYAYRLTGSAADAEDLTQQVFLTAQQKLGQLRKLESARSWLFAILRNRFLKSARDKWPLPTGSIGLHVDSIPAEPPPAEAIDRDALQKAINALPVSYRIVLLMFYYEDCSYREIAERLHLPIGTVMSRLARAKGRLRAELFGLGSGLEGRPAPSRVELQG